jgi:hypothetical protein
MRTMPQVNSTCDDFVWKFSQMCLRSKCDKEEGSFVLQVPLLVTEVWCLIISKLVCGKKRIHPTPTEISGIEHFLLYSWPYSSPGWLAIHQASTWLYLIYIKTHSNQGFFFFSIFWGRWTGIISNGTWSHDIFLWQNLITHYTQTQDSNPHFRAVHR